MKRNTYKSMPDSSGYFGKYGGRFVAETLIPLILEVENAYKKIKKKKKFIDEFKKYLKDYVGRPSPLYFAENLSKKLNGPKIYFKKVEQLLEFSLGSQYPSPQYDASAAVSPCSSHT